MTQKQGGGQTFQLYSRIDFLEYHTFLTISFSVNLQKALLCSHYSDKLLNDQKRRSHILENKLCNHDI